MYAPLFTISAEVINMIAEISGQIERYAIRLEQTEALHLRKANRISTTAHQRQWLPKPLVCRDAW